MKQKENTEPIVSWTTTTAATKKPSKRKKREQKKRRKTLIVSWRKPKIIRWCERWSHTGKHGTAIIAGAAAAASNRTAAIHANYRIDEWNKKQNSSFFRVVACCCCGFFVSFFRYTMNVHEQQNNNKAPKFSFASWKLIFTFALFTWMEKRNNDNK